MCQIVGNSALRGALHRLSVLTAEFTERRNWAT
jgi:hypothetical protein